MQIFLAAQPIVGTPAESYLKRRGITGSVPTSIKFHPSLHHPSGAILPAMVAIVARVIPGSARPCPTGVHRTWLDPKRAGEKARIEPVKAMLGPCRGGSVWLGTPAGDRPLVVAEGIETALSVALATKLPTWAALSASGIRNLVLPSDAREVIVAADNDETGLAAARAAAGRWTREHRHVRIATPPSPGSDFNDLLLEGRGR